MDGRENSKRKKKKNKYLSSNEMSTRIFVIPKINLLLTFAAKKNIYKAKKEDKKKGKEIKRSVLI